MQDDLISIFDFYDLLKSFLLAGLELEFEAWQLGGSFNTVPAHCQGAIAYLQE